MPCCRVDGVARLRGLGRRDGHVDWLTQRGRGIGLCLVGLGLGPGLLEGPGLGGVGIGIRVKRIASIGVHIGPVAQLITWQGLVPHLIRSLALAVPPFKAIDIHTGRPLGLANKHLLALYPQTARRSPAQIGKPSQHSTLFLVFEIFIECCNGLGGSHAANVTKGLSSCHIWRATGIWMQQKSSWWDSS